MPSVDLEETEVTDQEIQKRLHDKIKEEERSIRILEAELNIARLLSSREKRISKQGNDNIQKSNNNDWGGEDDHLLKVLDALQCSAKITIGDELENNSRDSIQSTFRMNPIWSGIKFDKVSGTLQDNDKIMYSLDGTIICVNWSFVVDISVRPSLHLNRQHTINGGKKRKKTGASLSQLLAKFHTTPNADEEKFDFPAEELAELELMSSNLCSLTFMFREVGCFADFHSNIRVPALKKIQQQSLDDCSCQFSILSAHAFSFTIVSLESKQPVLTMEMIWKWIFSPLGGGGSNRRQDELKISRCYNTEKDFFLNQEGLEDLVHIAGSCSEAIQILWRMFVSYSTKK